MCECDNAQHPWNAQGYSAVVALWRCLMWRVNSELRPNVRGHWAQANLLELLLKVALVLRLALRCGARTPAAAAPPPPPPEPAYGAAL